VQTALIRRFNLSKKFNHENQLSLFGAASEVLEPPVTVAIKTPVATAVAIATNAARELFVIGEQHLMGLTGPKAKLRANLDAIKIVVRKSGAITEAEKSTLAAYSGWGGLSAMFANTAEYQSERQELSDLVSKEWFESARESVLTAYFTEPDVIRPIWQMVEALGFKGGKVLEPACGTGLFVGAMPVELRKASQITMVEPDQISGQIATDLYADVGTRVHRCGIEHAPIRSDSFDLVIGNVPFGNYRVHDKKFDQLKLVIHDYFFAKSIDAVKPGGLVVLISSTGTLDKVQGNFRQYLAEKADLVTAIRLPSGAFARLGGTDVATDIIVFRKKCSISDDKVGMDFKAAVSQRLSAVGGGYCNQYASINEHFQENPDCLLGAPSPAKGQYGETVAYPAVSDWKGKLQVLCTSPALRGWFKAAESKDESALERIMSNTGIKTGLASGFFFDDAGTLLYRQGDEVESQQHLPTATRLRIEGMTFIRDHVAELLEVESMGGDGAAKRADLNRAYDNFVSQHGFLMRPVNRRLFSLDSHAPLMWSLEIYDEENETAVKADIFSKSTVSRAVLAETAESMSDAIALSYNRFGKMNFGFMAGALGSTESEVIAQLKSEQRVYLDPETFEHVDSEAYLSGKVLEKLEIAKAAYEGDEQFGHNVNALQPVVPVSIPMRDIGFQLGVPWIGAADVEEFVCSAVMAGEDDVKITHMAAMATWSVNMPSHLRKSERLIGEWGTARRPFDDLMSDLLNQRTTTVYEDVEYVVDNVRKTKRVVDKDETMAARDKADKIQTAFKAWVLGDEDRGKRLERAYNVAYNGCVNRKYDGSHLVIPGLSLTIEPRQAQKDSIWRGLVNGNTLFALATGGGKTLITIILAQEAKRLGLANKPVLAVPNHMLEAFAGEYARAFPRARILAASKNDLDGDRRRRLLMRMATGDWDCIIMTHSSLAKIGLSKEAVEEFADGIAEKLESSIRDVADDRNAVREAQRQKKIVTAKILTLADGGKKDVGVLSFDQLGVDMLLVDEADLFKNLWFHTKKTRVAGLTNVCSARALDMFLKSRMIADKRGHDGHGLVFATATPISNTIAEMFIMQTYLQPKRLVELEIDCFDAWAANFAREVTSIEVTPDGGGFRMHTRFAQFVNVPELTRIFGEVAEIRTKAMLKLPEPELAGGKHTIVAVPASNAQKAFVESLVARAEAIRNGQVKPHEDNMLCVTGDGRKAALDMRCIDGGCVEEPNGKVNACVENVYRHWDEGRSERLTQLVFCDLSTPKKHGFSVYHVIRDKLLAKGVPAHEIAFAQDYDTDAKKAELHRKVRAGRIRVLVGSTELMGFGTNVQDLLVAEHHLDAPWRPRDVEQRDGRIMRQGNRNELVWIYRYVTEQTFDAYMWQGLERKAGFIGQVMSGSIEIRSIEDVTTQALSFAEVKAIASGNPLVIEKAGIDAEVAKLGSLKSAWRNDQQRLADKASDLEWRIAFNKKRIAACEIDAEHCETLGEVTVAGRVMDIGEKAAKSIKSVVSAAKARVLNTEWSDKEVVNVFEIGNFKVNLGFRGTLNNAHYRYMAVGKSGVPFQFDLPYGADNIAAYLQARSLETEILNDLQGSREVLKGSQKELADVQREQLKPFEYEARFVAAIEKLHQIDASLGLLSDDESALLLAEEAVEA
jgi:N12 class adenine-specific DNA methylase